MPGVRGVSDGRVLRGRRNREAVVEALLALIEEGDIRPTAKAIAERAGISRRSVFQHFSDVEAIYAAAGDRVLDKLDPLLAPLDAGRPLKDRLEALGARRRSLFEVLDPMARSARLREPFSEALRANRARLTARLLEQCRQVFAPEVARRSAAEADSLVVAIAGAFSWDLWNHLRTDLHLDGTQTVALMTRMVCGLLGADAATVDFALPA